MLDLKNVVDNLPSAVIVVDPDRRVIMANRVAQLFSGQDENALIGKRGGDVMGCIHADESPEGCGYAGACAFCEAKNAVVLAFQKKTNIEPFEALIETASEGPLHLKFTVTVLNDYNAGADIELESVAVVTVDDMTEYKRRERLAAVLETVGAVCHEMNQPLMVLAGQIELLGMDMGGNSRIDSINKQIERMGDITRKLQSVRHYATKRTLMKDITL